MPKVGSRLALLGVVVVALLVVVLAVGRSDDGARRRPAVQLTLDGLCASVDAGESGDLDVAHGRFLARAHSGLHDIAAALADSGNRPAAARLLEAKAAVEASLPQRSSSAVADLRQLLEVTQEAVTSGLGRSVSCEAGSGGRR